MSKDNNKLTPYILDKKMIETTGDDLFIRNESGKSVRFNRDVYQIAASRLLEQLYGETK